MIFITPDDILPYIKPNILADTLEIDSSELSHGELTEVLSGNTLLNYYETYAIDYVKTHISMIYDTELIFSMTGSTRSPMIIKFVSTILLNELYSRSYQYQKPEIITQNYSEVITILQDVARKKYNIALPLRNEKLPDEFYSEKPTNYVNYDYYTVQNPTNMTW